MQVFQSRTPNKNHSNRPSPSSGESTASAFWSSKHTLSSSIPDAFINSLMPCRWHEKFERRGSAVVPNAEVMESAEDADREVNRTWAPGPARMRMCCGSTNQYKYGRYTTVDKVCVPRTRVQPRVVWTLLSPRPLPCVLSRRIRHVVSVSEVLEKHTNNIGEIGHW